MYSVVLLMALSGGAESPAFCGGGCNGGGRGCNGGGLFSGRGCNGGGRGCRGSSGCSGCSGAAYCGGGGYCSGGGGYCSGGGYGYCSGGGGYCSGGMAIGCSGGYGHGGVIIGCPGGVVVPPAKEMPKKEDEKKPGEVAAPATIIINLPADARLLVDDAPTTSTSATRVLVSPTLEPGREFHYTLKAEIVRDGKTQATSQRITVRAGEETRVNLQFPVASVAQK